MAEPTGHPSISKREFRKLSALPRNVLDFLIYQYGTLQGIDQAGLKDIFREIERTGTLPDGRPLLSLAKTGLGEVSELPTDVGVSRRIQQEIQGLPADINKLSQEEITQKIGLFEELGEKGRFFNRGQVLKEVKESFSDFEFNTLPDSLRNVLAEKITEEITNKEAFPTAERIVELAREHPEYRELELEKQQLIDKYAQSQKIRNSFIDKISAQGFLINFPLGKEQAESLGELKSRLREIQEKETRESDISKFIETELPERGERAVSELEQALQKSQQQFFTGEITPAVIQSLSARGLLRGGDLASALAEQAGKLQTGIQQTIAPLRFETKQAPIRLRYEDLLRQALESGQSLNQAVDFTRTLFQQDLQRQFQASQSQLERTSREDINRQNFALQLALMSQQPGRPNAFLQHGLPFLGQVLGGSGSSIVGQGLSALSGFFRKGQAAGSASAAGTP